MVEVYPRGEKPPASTEEAFSRARVQVQNIKLDSSPGFPLMRAYATNEEVLNTLGSEYLVERAVERYMLLMRTPIEQLKSATAEQLVWMGVVDPIRMFVKSEPHSEKKVAEGRMRLIMSVSVVDQMVERMLCANQDLSEVEAWETIPSKPGMGLNDESLSSLQQCIRKMKVPAGTDIIAHDFSVQLWGLLMDATRRARLAGCEGEATMWHKRAVCLGLSIVLSSDGDAFRQKWPGIMKSGAKITSSSTSSLRGMSRALIAPPEECYSGVMTMGDDCVEDVGWMTPAQLENCADELTRRYAALGFRIKEVQVLGNGCEAIEFCAHEFNLRDGFVPVRWDKVVAQFCLTWPEESQMDSRLDALMYVLRHSPQLGYVMGLLEAIEVERCREGAPQT